MTHREDATRAPFGGDRKGPRFPGGRALLAIGVLLGTCHATGPGSALAQGSAGTPARVLVVLAREAPGRIDPSLRDVPALRRPPFNTFRSMEVLERDGIRLLEDRPTQVALPNGRRLRITLQQVLPDGRFRVQVSINRPEQSDYLPLLTVVASPGEPFFVAGQSFRGGTLVVGVEFGPGSRAGEPSDDG